MKLLLSSFLVFILFFSACSKKEEGRLEAFNAEAFAFDTGDVFEVNATTRVKGFVQKEADNKFSASLALNIHLVKPDGDTAKSLITRVEDKIEDEKMSDVPLEVQFDLDSTYSDGNYKLIFEIKDVNTDQTATSAAEFKIEKE